MRQNAYTARQQLRCRMIYVASHSTAKRQMGTPSVLDLWVGEQPAARTGQRHRFRDWASKAILTKSVKATALTRVRLGFSK